MSSAGGTGAVVVGGAIVSSVGGTGAIVVGGTIDSSASGAGAVIAGGTVVTAGMAGAVAITGTIVVGAGGVSVVVDTEVTPGTPQVTAYVVKCAICANTKWLPVSIVVGRATQVLVAVSK